MDFKFRDVKMGEPFSPRVGIFGKYWGDCESRRGFPRGGNGIYDGEDGGMAGRPDAKLIEHGEPPLLETPARNVSTSLGIRQFDKGILEGFWVRFSKGGARNRKRLPAGTAN